MLKTSWEACQGTDVLVESPSAMGGYHIAEALAIPYFRAFTMTWTRTRSEIQVSLVFMYSSSLLFFQGIPPWVCCPRTQGKNILLTYVHAFFIFIHRWVEVTIIWYESPLQVNCEEVIISLLIVLRHVRPSVLAGNLWTNKSLAT